jgi:hypothetical protein
MLNSRIPDGIYKDEKGGHSGVGALGQILSALAAANAQNATGGGSGDGTETIDGSTTQAIATTTSLRVMSDGANWIIV